MVLLLGVVAVTGFLVHEEAAIERSGVELFTDDSPEVQRTAPRLERLIEETGRTWLSDVTAADEINTLVAAAAEINAPYLLALCNDLFDEDIRLPWIADDRDTVCAIEPIAALMATEARTVLADYAQNQIHSICDGWSHRRLGDDPKPVGIARGLVHDYERDGGFGFGRQRADLAPRDRPARELSRGTAQLREGRSSAMKYTGVVPMFVPTVLPTPRPRGGSEV